MPFGSRARCGRPPESARTSVRRADKQAQCSHAVVVQCGAITKRSGAVDASPLSERLAFRRRYPAGKRLQMSQNMSSEIQQGFAHQNFADSTRSQLNTESGGHHPSSQLPIAHT